MSSSGVAGRSRSGTRELGPSLVAAVPPTLPEGVIRRPRLEELLERGIRRRLTTVVADAGFGKSTLLAWWARSRAVAWHTATPPDRDPGTLAAGLVRSISLQLPRIGEATEDILGIARGPDAATDEPSRTEALAGAICSAIEAALGSDLMLVIDDLEVLGGGEASSRFVAAICRQAPSGLHVVLSSRAEPTFMIQRLRLQGQVLEITGQDLACTHSETIELVGAILGEDASAIAGPLHEASAGWPAAIRLAGEALSRVDPSHRPATLDRLIRTGDPLIGSLIEQVLDRETAAVRHLVATMARFDRFTVPMAATLGVDAAEQLIPALERRGLFLQSLGGGDWYAIHPVVRTYVQDRLVPAPSTQIAIATKAAGWALRNGHDVEALAIAMSQRIPVLINRIVTERGASLLAAGVVDPLLEAIAALPSSTRTPAVRRLEGEALQVRGDWDRALSCFEGLASDGSALDPGVAWRMGLIHHLRGELDRALEVYARGDVDQGTTADLALLHAWWAAAAWLRGDVEVVRRLAAKALDLAQVASDHRALAVAHTVLAMLAATDGDRRANDVHYLRALDHAVIGRDVLTQIRIRANRGSRFIEEGAYAAALDELDRAIRLAELTGFAVFHALALSNRGEALWRLGRLDEARPELEQARSIYQQLDSRLVAYPLRHLGDVHRVRGDLALARAYYEEAISVSEPAGDVQGLVPALAGLALVLADTEPDEAEAAARRALAAGPALGRVGALLAFGWISLGRERRARAEESMREAAALARTRRDRAGLAEALELEAALESDPALARARLDEARSIWQDVGATLGVARVDLATARLVTSAPAADRSARAADARAAFGAAGARSTGPPGSAAEHDTATPPLELRTLGGFEVTLDGRPVRIADWGSRRARDLVKILVARRGHRVPREQLMETLWPEEDPTRTARRLSVMISTARAVLDPERRLDPVGGIGGDRDAVWLALPPSTVDVERFLRAADAALAEPTGRAMTAGTADRVALLEAAASIYRGDFLEDEPYAEWAAGLRDEARRAYLRVEHALADTATAAGDLEAAARHLRRIIEREPDDEDAHLALIARLSEARRPAEARRAYRRYVAQMDELGAEAAPFPQTGSGPAHPAQPAAV